MNKVLSLSSMLIILSFLIGCSNSSENTEQNPSTNSNENTSNHETSNITWDKNNLSPEIKAIIDRGNIRVGMVSQNINGFCAYNENGELVGIDVEISKNLASSLGVELIIDKNIENFNLLQEKILNKSVDFVISRYSASPERSAYISLSNPYLNARLGIMANKQQLVINKIEKNPLKYMMENELKIGVLAGTAYVNLAKKFFLNATIVEMNTYDDLSNSVLNGDIFAYFSGETQFMDDYTKNPELRLYTSVFVFSDIEDDFCIGISKDTPELLSYVNTFIETQKKYTIQDVENNLIESTTNS